MFFKGCSRKFLKKFHGYFKSVSRKFKSISRKFQGCLEEDCMVLQESFQFVSSVFERSSKGISEKFQRCFKRMFQGCFK